MTDVSYGFIAKRRSILNGKAIEQDYAIADLEFVGGEVSLTVFTDWSDRHQAWGMSRRYTINEAATSWNGRSFMVRRMGGCSDGSERYATFVSADEAPDFCECQGQVSRGYCIHVDFVRWVINNIMEIDVSKVLSPAAMLAQQLRPKEEVEERTLLCDLKAKREELGLTQAHVAQAIGTNSSAIGNIEKGLPPKLDTAIALAAFFGCSVADLWPEAAAPDQADASDHHLNSK